MFSPPQHGKKNANKFDDAELDGRIGSQARHQIFAGFLARLSITQTRHIHRAERGQVQTVAATISDGQTIADAL